MINHLYPISELRAWIWRVPNWNSKFACCPSKHIYADLNWIFENFSMESACKDVGKRSVCSEGHWRNWKRSSKSSESRKGPNRFVSSAFKWPFGIHYRFSWLPSWKHQCASGIGSPELPRTRLHKAFERLLIKVRGSGFQRVTDIQAESSALKKSSVSSRCTLNGDQLQTRWSQRNLQALTMVLNIAQRPRGSARSGLPFKVTLRPLRCREYLNFTANNLLVITPMIGSAIQTSELSSCIHIGRL